MFGGFGGGFLPVLEFLGLVFFFLIQFMNLLLFPASQITLLFSVSD